MGNLQLLPDSWDLTPLGRRCLCNNAHVERFSRGAGEMTTIMPFEEPRTRGTVLGQRADRLRVGEAYHFFRCNACNGWIDARDYVWAQDHEGPRPQPAQDRVQ